ncbi:MAG: NAD(P)/FAD-dependent oxidoreductase [Dehalococcoidia bacterium]
MPANVVVLGAGFGGLEVAARLSAEFGADANVTVIEKNEGFVFGFDKFELMLGRATLDQVRLGYAEMAKPGVSLRQEEILSIDPLARRVTTTGGQYDADMLVVALGAEYDQAATPGFVEGGSEFYSIDGALKMRDVLPRFQGGQVLIGVLGEPFKCPPAPCEAAILLDEYFTARGLAGQFAISYVSPWGRPIPPSPDGSATILGRFAERGISFIKERMVTHIDPATKTAHLKDGGTLPYDLFIGIPRHRVPAVVAASGLAENGWIPVERGTLATKFPGVYAVGDVTSVGTPKAGVFSENAARVVAAEIIAQIRGSEAPPPFGGAGTCYVELGAGQVARLDADFFGGPSPVAPLTGPNPETAAEKRAFSSVRRAHWFQPG